MSDKKEDSASEKSLAKRAKLEERKKKQNLSLRAHKIHMKNKESLHVAKAGYADPNSKNATINTDMKDRLGNFRSRVQASRERAKSKWASKR